MMNDWPRLARASTICGITLMQLHAKRPSLALGQYSGYRNKQQQRAELRTPITLYALSP